MVTIRPSAPAWLNNTVRKAIRKRKRAHKKAKVLKTNEAWRKYRILRNESVRILRTAKQEYKSNLAKKLNSNNMSSRDWWKIFKACIGKDSHESLPPLNHNGQMINNPKEKADL